jgi:flagellar M-ring protein FliF
MDFLNKYFAQIRELFEGMTPGARITSALLLAVTLVSLGYLFSSGFGSASGEVFLLDNRAFSSDELAAMEGAFAAEGLGGYEIVAGRIRVPRGKQTDFVAALAKGGALPHDFSSILEDALKNSGTFEDKRKLDARLRFAKQKYLEQVFRSMNDYQRAAVMIDEEIKPGLKRERVVTASVSIKPIGTLALDDSQVESICQTMAGSVAGLKPEDVVVTDMNTGRSRRGSPGDSADGAGTTMAKEQQIQEDHWRRKIEDLLALVPGVIVTPTVELAPERKHVTSSTMYDQENSLAYQLSESKTSRDYFGEAKQGRPGYVPNSANSARTLNTTDAKGSEEKEKTSDLVESKLPAGEETHKEFAPHPVERVSVAIAVPTSYFTKVWRERNPTPPGEEPQEPVAGDITPIREEVTDQIKSLVARALPTPTDPSTTGETKLDLVQVTDFQDIIPASLPEPTLTENAGSWFAQNWSTLGLIALGLFSLLMLRSMIRSTPPGGDTDTMDFGSTPADGSDGEVDEEDETPRAMAFSGTGASLRDELSELVAGDPETAANILRNWIGTPVK